MISLLWKYRGLVTVVALLALAFYIVALQRKDEDDYNFVDHLIVKVTGPIQGAIGYMQQSSGDAWEHYVANQDAVVENTALKQQIADLQRHLSTLDEVRRENHRLLGLVSLYDRSEGVSYITARVVANSTSPHFRSLRIDQGSNEGVVRGMGVVSEAGLVGRVMSVEKHYSDVILLSDSASTIDIYIGRSRARGRLRGMGEPTTFGARIDYLVRSASVEVGDEVYTTGAGLVFPKGLLIGYVISVNKVEHGLYQEALVEPAASLGALDEVAVVKAFGPDALVRVPTSLPATTSQPTSLPTSLPFDMLDDMLNDMLDEDQDGLYP